MLAQKQSSPARDRHDDGNRDHDGARAGVTLGGNRRRVYQAVHEEIVVERTKPSLGNVEAYSLFLDQVRVAGYALPKTILEDPHVRESAPVLEGLALVLPLRVIGPGHDGSAGIRIDFYVFIRDQAGLICRIFQ